ncbi:ribosomal protein S18-alanine N-acetyltransferase [Haloterrigena alkaliphila]|uniref:Ribosomal protein S18-alanine N-acetyltransferase n=1 Tax=Haloterrigena alkaliphila TaxID=2816475 RepID=A0A8A2VIB3_9EURY|nr:ribosomal protein S18-alanine N-acetyltransferase [Haloterrigena alkaliphila]QSX00451.1 ribosomal protein S18-alanine N-acetyltransferase [Haloterrigena alkaliphila]
MTTPVPGAGGDDGVSIRPAERADLLAVVRIENESFPQPWPYDAFDQYLGEPAFLVAVESGEVVGYVVGTVNRNFGRYLGHIKDVAVHPERRGLGVGTSLLRRALAVLAAHGADTVKLEVRRSNDRAKRLYRQFGFEPFRRVPGYYGDGEDAIVMMRKFE